VPFALIGKTVQVVRQGGSWVIRHRCAVVKEKLKAGLVRPHDDSSSQPGGEI
jgi:hypothetical protein